VQPRLLHLVLLVEQDGHLAVPLDPRDRLDHHAFQSFFCHNHELSSTRA
jgi:hypothetical protein